MKHARRIIVTCMVALFVAPAGALAAQHLNAYNLQSDFMCVSCHEPLNQVNSPESQAEKIDLARFVAQGLSYQRIKQKMVNIYGEEVLAKPPAHGISLLVYILPPVVLFGGLALLAYNLPRWRQRARLQQALDEAGPTGPPPEQADVDRLERELAEFDH